MKKVVEIELEIEVGVEVEKEEEEEERRRSVAERDPDTPSPGGKEPRKDVCHARHPLPQYDGSLFIVICLDEKPMSLQTAIDAAAVHLDRAK
uniref:Uncharacterized protein n=1 Tax=Vespula pensylvanica TaxID=30213 RepID=A0A834NXB0_VESPE|nr:hypothetical protein H0235_010610 [Vespula pensylvanica]